MPRTKLPLLLLWSALSPACDGGEKETRQFDLGSFGSIDASVSPASPGTVDVELHARLVPMESSEGCPVLAPDLKFTANGHAPTYATAPRDFSDALALFAPCRVSEALIVFTIPAFTGTLVVELTQGTVVKVMEVDFNRPIGADLVSLAPAQVSPGGSFSAELAPTAGNSSPVLNGPGCWHAWLCHSGMESNCAPESVEVISSTAIGSHLRLDLRTYAPDGPGARSLFMMIDPFASCLTAAIVRCGPGFSCAAHPVEPPRLGPFPFQVE